MQRITVGVVVGSLRKDSINLRLAKALEKLMPTHVGFQFISLDRLPLYNQDMDAAYPPECQRFKSEVAQADSLLFVTPEYNRSMPGVLKNALDIGSRPWGQNSFSGKPGAVVGASLGAIGSALAQQHLRNVLSYLDVALLTQPEVYLQIQDDLIDADGNVNNESTRAFLQGFVAAYVEWLQRLL